MKVFLLIFAAAITAMAQPTLPNAVPMPTPEIQYLSATGKPLAGAFLCTYQAGTTTPQNTYTDSTAGTPNTDPIVLDVNGRASVWIGPQLYKFVLYVGGNGACPGTGAVQWTQDNVTDTTLYLTNYVETVGTCTLITFKLGGTGPVTRTCSAKLADHPSLWDFGPVGDGVADDTTAIQAAIAWASATGNTQIDCGTGGTFLVHTITFPPNIRLSGGNMGAPTGEGNGGCRFKSIAAEPLISIPNSTNGQTFASGGIDHVFLDCSSTGTIGLYVGTANFLDIDNVTAANCTNYGWVTDNTQNSHFYNMTSRADAIGYGVTNGTGNCVFDRIEGQLTGGAAIGFLGVDAALPNGTGSNAVYGSLQNSFYRLVLGDGGAYSYALHLQTGSDNLFFGINATDYSGMSTSGTAILFLDTASSKNQFFGMAIEVGTDLTLIENLGNENSFWGGSVSLVPGCTGPAITSATGTVHFYGTTSNDGCFYSTATGNANWFLNQGIGNFVFGGLGTSQTLALEAPTANSTATLDLAPSDSGGAVADSSIASTFASGGMLFKLPRNVGTHGYQFYDHLFTTRLFFIDSVNGFLTSGTTVPPTVTSGFGSGPAIVAGASPVAGRLTVGSGGTAKTGLISFGGNWPSIPSCTANDENKTAVIPVTATPTVGSLTLTSQSAWVAGDVLSWVCIGPHY